MLRVRPFDSEAIRSELTLDAAAESVHLLDGGGQAYPRMLLAIARAQRSVHLEAYAFAASGVGVRFAGWPCGW